ncbi:MAG: hypothetical protein Q9168_004832 [Polycauliona sp. 1 TL-2023]
MPPHAYRNLAVAGDCKASTLNLLCQTPYHFEFPANDTPNFAQDAEFVDVTFPAAVIYSYRGLYEFLFHGRRMEWQFHRMIVSLLQQSIDASSMDAVRILKIGAGNGIVAGELRLQLGSAISRLVGVEHFPESKVAVVRDRPDVFDQSTEAEEALLGGHCRRLPYGTPGFLVESLLADTLWCGQRMIGTTVDYQHSHS